MKRAATGAATFVGLVLVICAVMGFITLGAHGTWRSDLQVPAGRSAVVIEPALASVMGPRITVRASASDDAQLPLFAGRARPDDASALVEGSDRLVVQGLDGGRDLRTTSGSGSDPMPAPDAVDVWDTSAVAPGSVQLSYRATRGAQSVVIARADGQPMPALSLRISWAKALWYWVPAVLLLAGLALIALGRWANRPRTAVRSTSASARRRRRPVAPGRPSAAGTKHVGKRRATTGRRA